LGVCLAVSPSTRLAVGSYRALRAFRLSRHANQRSQLHDGLIELPGSFAVFGDESTGEIPDAALRDEALPGGALSGEAFSGKALPVVSEENSQQYATYVCVDGRNGLFKGEASHRASSIPSDAR